MGRRRHQRLAPDFDHLDSHGLELGRARPSSTAAGRGGAEAKLSEFRTKQFQFRVRAVNKMGSGTWRWPHEKRRREEDRDGGKGRASHWLRAAGPVGRRSRTLHVATA